MGKKRKYTIDEVAAQVLDAGRAAFELGLRVSLAARNGGGVLVERTVDLETGDVNYVLTEYTRYRLVKDEYGGGEAPSLAEFKAAVEEWFTDISLDDLFAVKGWKA